MKNSIKAIVVLFFLTLLVSCKSSKPVAVEKSEITNTKIIKETLRDTIITVEKDSSFYQAYIDCQNGKAIIREVTQEKAGRNLKSPAVRVTNDNKLEVNCETEAHKLFLKWKEKFISELSTEYTEVPTIVNELTWWQKTQIKGFWLLVALIAIRFLITKII